MAAMVVDRLGALSEVLYVFYMSRGCYGGYIDTLPASGSLHAKAPNLAPKNWMHARETWAAKPKSLKRRAKSANICSQWLTPVVHVAVATAEAVIELQRSCLRNILRGKAQWFLYRTPCTHLQSSIHTLSSTRMSTTRDDICDLPRAPSSIKLLLHNRQQQCSVGVPSIFRPIHDYTLSASPRNNSYIVQVS